MLKRNRKKWNFKKKKWNVKMKQTMSGIFKGKENIIKKQKKKRKVF